MPFTKETATKGGKASKRRKSKTSLKIRNTFTSILADNETNIQSWLDQTAEKEPAKALDLILKIAGFVIFKTKAETTKEIREQPLFLDEELSLLSDDELQKQLDKAQRVLALPPIRFAETSKTKFKLIQ
jgi:hypothetical protein